MKFSSRLADARDNVRARGKKLINYIASTRRAQLLMALIVGLVVGGGGVAVASSADQESDYRPGVHHEHDRYDRDSTNGDAQDDGEQADD